MSVEQRRKYDPEFKKNVVLLADEPYKLISVADIVSLVKIKNESLDREKIQKIYPQLLKILPLLHY